MRHVLALAFAGALTVMPALAADKAGPAPAVVQDTDTVQATKAYCYLEGSAGKNVTSSRLSNQVDGAVTLSADGAQVGFGLGCDLDVGKFFAGILGRYDFTDVSGSFSDAKIGQDSMWMLAARGGFKLNYATRVYGLAGIAGTDLTYGDLKLSPDGIVYGAGIETDLSSLGAQNMVIGIEWDHIAWKKANEFDTALRPDTDIIRATLKLKLDLFK